MAGHRARRAGQVEGRLDVPLGEGALGLRELLLEEAARASSSLADDGRQSAGDGRASGSGCTALTEAPCAAHTVPSGAIASAWTPASTCAFASSRWPSASNTRTVRSPEPDSRSEPSGDSASAWTGCACDAYDRTSSREWMPQSRTTPSSPAATTRACASSRTSASTRPVGSARRASGRPSSRDHRRTVPSRLAEARRDAPAATAVTASSWAAISRRHRPAATSNSRTVRSEPPTTTIGAPGADAREVAKPTMRSNARTARPDVRSHSASGAPSAPTSRKRPPGRTASERTGPPSMASVRSSWPEPESHTRTSLPLPAMTVRPSGVRASAATGPGRPRSVRRGAAGGRPAASTSRARSSAPPSAVARASAAAASAPWPRAR